MPDANPEADPVSGSANSGVFATTHWSVVLAAGQKDSSQAAAALEKLCRAYWYPLYAFIRRSGKSPHDAQDFTQGFFAFILERDFLSKASPHRGRFRSFLLGSLKHFLSDAHDRANALKRGGANTSVSLDGLVAEERYATEPVDAMSPDKIFERRWAMTLLAQARSRLEEEYSVAGKRELYRELSRFDAAEGEGLSYAKAASQLSMPENTLKSAVHRLRRRYRELLREEIAQTVASPLEIDDEISYMLSVLRG